MTKVYISLEKTDLHEWCDIYLLTYFWLFPRNLQRAMTYVIVTRCLGDLVTKPDKNNNSVTSLETDESPKSVIFNENDTDKIYHEDIFMVF